METVPSDKEIGKYFFIMYKLAAMGAQNRAIKASTKFLAEKIGYSQQSVSRYLIDLENLGWIQRTGTPDGNLIRISDQGEAHLRKVYTTLRGVFEEKHPLSITIEGIVFSGLGEGAYYVTREPYRKQFIEQLGFDPFPGTLNVKITSQYDNKLKEELENYEGIVIEGFKNENRTYGSVKCFPVLINNREKGTIVYAFRTHYSRSVMEIISKVNLRDRLKLKDGNKVKVEVLLTKPE